MLFRSGSLTEAIALYQRSGYRPVERYNDNPFAQLFFAKVLPRGGPEEPQAVG